MKRYPLLLFISYFVAFVSVNAYPDLIESLTIVNKNKIIVKANEQFSKQFVKEDFFAEYDETIDLTKLDESIVTIPFILNIVPVVWFCNKKYSLEVMDEDLYYSLQKIREIFRLFYPQHTWAGELVPKKLVSNIPPSSSQQDEPILAILFTGGLDSVNASLSHIDTKQLLITAWGADVKVKAEQEWQRVFDQVKQFAHTYGPAHTFIKSNFREFVKTRYLYTKFSRWWVRVSHGLSFTGLVAPLLVQKNIPTLLISSTFTVKHPDPHGVHPAIDNNISFAGKKVYHADGDKDRVQKIQNINALCTRKKLTLPCLRVCWADPLGGNCLTCETRTHQRENLV